MRLVIAVQLEIHTSDGRLMARFETNEMKSEINIELSMVLQIDIVSMLCCIVQ